MRAVNKVKNRDLIFIGQIAVLFMLMTRPAEAKTGYFAHLLRLILRVFCFIIRMLKKFKKHLQFFLKFAIIDILMMMYKGEVSNERV